MDYDKFRDLIQEICTDRQCHFLLQCSSFFGPFGGCPALLELAEQRNIKHTLWVKEAKK